MKHKIANANISITALSTLATYTMVLVDELAIDLYSLALRQLLSINEKEPTATADGMIKSINKYIISQPDQAPSHIFSMQSFRLLSFSKNNSSVIKKIEKDEANIEINEEIRMFMSNFSWISFLCHVVLVLPVFLVFFLSFIKYINLTSFIISSIAEAIYS